MPPPPLTWHAAFVVTTVALGGSVEDARQSLASEDWPLAEGSLPLLPGLTSPDRSARARALATGLALVCAELELTRLA
jgi:hypothetical protein